MTIVIRSATQDDAATIAASNSAIAKETEGYALDPMIVGPGVTRLLANRQKGHYWVAEDNGRSVGQIMVTYEWSDWRDGFFWWIQSVYVHADYRRRGVFTRLYRHVEDLAQNTPDVIGLRLYVERENSRAQKTYLQLGMVDPGYQVMQTVFDE